MQRSDRFTPQRSYDSKGRWNRLDHSPPPVIDNLTRFFLDGGTQVTGRRHLNDRAIFGRSLSDREIFNLAGAPQNGRVEISPSEHGSLFCLKVTSPDIKKQKITQLHTGGEGLYLHHGDFNVQTNAPEGFATRAVAVQVKAARTLGISFIQLLAEGSPGSAKWGYQVWPKMGFNASLEKSLASRLPGLLRGAQTVLDLYERGRDGILFWANNGSQCNMRLGIKDTSRGLHVLEKYLDRKKINIPL